MLSLIIQNFQYHLFMKTMIILMQSKSIMVQSKSIGIIQVSYRHTIANLINDFKELEKQKTSDEEIKKNI